MDGKPLDEANLIADIVSFDEFVPVLLTSYLLKYESTVSPNAPFLFNRRLRFHVRGSQESVNTDGGVIDAKRDQKFFKEDTYSPYAGRNFPDTPLWGDQHLHTSWSPDAAGGGTRLGPEEA